MTFDPNLNRTVITQEGEPLHLAGLASLLEELGRIPQSVANRIGLSTRVNYVGRLSTQDDDAEIVFFPGT